MEVDQEQDVEGTEKLVDSDEKKKLECTPKIIIIIVIANLVFIAVNIILIHFLSLSKVDHISTIMKDYVKDYTKSAITDERIMHLIKSQNNSNSSIRYQELANLQNLVFNATYEYLNSNEKFKGLLNMMNNLTFKYVIPGVNYDNAIEHLYRVLTQEEDWRIYQLMDKDDLKTINEAIHQGNGDKYKEQLKVLILHGLINLPFQVFYFSKNKNTTKEFKDTIKKKLPDNLTEIIESSMQDLKEKKILMVLGCDQVDENDRINASFNGYQTPINFIDVGLRSKFSEKERTEEKLKENIGYYLNADYNVSMMKCFAEKVDDSKFNNFIEELRNIAYRKDETYMDKIDEFEELFRKYTFSVEVANTIINYIQLNIEKEKINIIRLGEEYRNEVDKFNKNEVFILYNVADISKSGDTDTLRSTSYSNGKAIKYLKKEHPNFLSDDEYNNIVLVSTQGDAERQLEAFNIASNLSSIKNEKNETMKWNQVVWNKNKEEKFDKNKTIEIMLEAMVKSYNLIATNFFEIHEKGEDNYLFNLSNAFTDLIKYYQNL